MHRGARNYLHYTQLIFWGENQMFILSIIGKPLCNPHDLQLQFISSNIMTEANLGLSINIKMAHALPFSSLWSKNIQSITIPWWDFNLNLCFYAPASTSIAPSLCFLFITQESIWKQPPPHSHSIQIYLMTSSCMFLHSCAHTSVLFIPCLLFP